MLVVLDTNILVSALLVETSQPARLVELWRRGSFQLVTSAPQLEELARVTRYEKLRYRLVPALTGRLVNDLRDIAVLVDRLPRIEDRGLARPVRQLSPGHRNRRLSGFSGNRR